MGSESINAIAESFGLTVETVSIPEHGPAVRVYKGAKQIFVGTEEAVREFFGTYPKERPALFEGSMYGYKE